MSARGRRVVVVGAGALGTVYGAGLARGGATVQLLARRPHAEAIQAAGGVEIRGVDGSWHAELDADWRPERIEPADTVIVMTKSRARGGGGGGGGNVKRGLGRGGGDRRRA